MAGSLALPSDNALVPLLDVTAKRSDVEALITNYAVGHAAMDIGIGLAGFLPIPGAAIASTVAAIAAQAPVVYQPMARDIARIYSRSVERPVQAEVLRGALGGAIQDAAVFFGVEFFNEIAGELLREVGFGLGLAAIPVLGGFVGMALDVRIAWALTWRVGLMTALYYENGGKWFIDRKRTYELASKFIKADKDHGNARPRIADFIDGAKEVKENQDAVVVMMAQFLLSAGITKEEVRTKLLDRGIEPGLVDRALSRC